MAFSLLPPQINFIRKSNQIFTSAVSWNSCPELFLLTVTFSMLGLDPSETMPYISFLTDQSKMASLKGTHIESRDSKIEGVSEDT